MIFCVSNEKYKYIGGYKNPYRNTYTVNDFESVVKDNIDCAFVFNDDHSRDVFSAVDVYIRIGTELIGGHKIFCKPDAYEVVLTSIKILSSQVGTVFGYLISDLMEFILDKRDVHFSFVDSPFSVQAFLSGLKPELIKEAHYLSTIDVQAAFDEFSEFDCSFKTY